MFYLPKMIIHDAEHVGDIDSAVADGDVVIG